MEEKYKVKCDAVMRCEEWERNIQAITGAQIFCAIHSAGPKYMRPQFRFCPWCGGSFGKEKVVRIKLPEEWTEEI
jgi:hypothetical protein